MNDEPTLDVHTVLVVDDDDVFRTRLLRAFTERGFEARGAASVEQALELARSDSPEYAVVDLRMPQSSGLEAVRGLTDIDYTTQIVVLTGYGSIATAVEAIRLGAIHYLTKPVDVDQILSALRGEYRAASSEDEIPTPSLARVEWEHIQRVLQDSGGNVSQAARVLGLHRRSLQRKLGKMPVRR